MDTRRQRIRRKLIFIFFLLLPLTLNYYSPALMTQGTAERVATFSLLLWTAIFLTSFVLGRSFCGYACPFHGLQMAWETVRDKPLRRVRYLRWIKYALWGLWVGAVVAFAVSTSGWERFDPLYNTENVVSVDSPQNLIVYYVLRARDPAATRTGEACVLPVLLPVRRVGHRGNEGAARAQAARPPPQGRH